MFPVVPERALLELARTEGGSDTLTLLVRDQDTRRLLLLRAVLDAAEGAERSVCTAAQKARLRADWALLTEADRPPSPGAPTSEHRPGRAATRRDRDAPPGARGTSAVADAPTGAWSTHAADDAPTGAWGSRAGAGAAPAGGDARFANPARARLFHPLTGPWARSCLRGLDAAPGPAGGERERRLRRDLAHFSAIAAVVAAGAGIPFSTRLTARAGVLALPSLGALHTARSGDVPVDVTCTEGRLVLRQADAPDVTVHL